MAHGVPGPGSAPEAPHDWFADFAEEEPEAPPRRRDDSSDGLDSFAPEADLRLIDPSSAIDGWTLERPALVRPRGRGRAMRFIALAAGLLALAAWWIVPRLRADVTVPDLPPPPPPAPLAAPAEPPSPPIDIAAAAAAAAPVTDAPEPRDVAPPAAPEMATPEAPAIDAVLSRYRAAFGALDANGVAEVWPAADRAALERTFAGLTFQSLEFDECAIDVRDLDARASCRGRARVVTKATAKTLLEPRRWEFILRKDERGWEIRSVK